MTIVFDIETNTLEQERASLERLWDLTPDDTFAKPLMAERLAELKAFLVESRKPPRIAPGAMIFFEDGPALGTEGLEATFASSMLDSYQNMVTNHYAARHCGILRRTGRRRGEADTKLYLTALPRGSFGLELTQPHVADFVTAEYLSKSMLEISGLIESSAESDQAFENALNVFNPRVLKPLQRFLSSLFAGGGACRVVTGDKETSLTREQIADAYDRVTAATEEETTITMPGTFGGVLTYSWEFDFQPDQGELIHGPLAEDVGEETATEWNLNLTHQRTVATMRVTTVSTRTGKKKPSYELLGLQHTRAPADEVHKE